MKKFNLEVKEREILGKKVKGLRGQGFIPGIVYGTGVKNRNIVVDEMMLQKLYEEAGESSIIDLKINEEKSIPVIIQDIQSDPLQGKPMHVDFRQIRMDEELVTEIDLKFVGEAPAVKELGGTLIKNFDSLEVECLPKDLVPSIEVDLGVLKTFDDIIRIKDLNIPSGIKVLQDQERSIAVVAPPVSEEELAAMEKAPEEAIEEVKVVGQEEKKEEEEEKKEKPEAPEEKGKPKPKE